MKVAKKLILGSAAGLLAIGGAQAADLSVKAKAVEYVKICSLYGVPSGMRLEFGRARSPGNTKVSFQAARSIG
ncbi:MAG: hypothetical protein ACXWKP_28260 [Bradyrhizobium sp.]|jgi:hypothetical protein